MVSGMEMTPNMLDQHKDSDSHLWSMEMQYRWKMLHWHLQQCYCVKNTRVRDYYKDLGAFFFLIFLYLAVLGLSCSM